MQIPASILHTHFTKPVLGAVQTTAKLSGIKAYLVGGFVRDLYLGKTSKDVDIMVVGSGIGFAQEVAKALPAKSVLSEFKNFGTAQLKFREEEVEFVGARKESYQRNSRNPVVENGTLEDDLLRRDFTINALAIDVETLEIIDMFNGKSDLEKGIIRTPLDADITFSDDPLRILRAIRFASQLNFTLEEKTWQGILNNVHRLEIITQERITEEVNKIILSAKPSIGFLLLHQSGILKMIFPELCELEGVKTIDGVGHKDNFYHTLQVLDGVAKNSDDLWLRWAAIMHDIAKPQTQKFLPETGWTFHGHEVLGTRMTSRVFKRMKLPMNEKMKFVQKMVYLHLRPIALTHEVTDSAIRRLIVEAGEDIVSLLTLCRADITSKNEEKVTRYLRRFDEVEEKIKYVEEKDNLRNWKNPITGEIIMDTYGISPSKMVGDIKEEIKEAIMNGDIPNEYEAAYLLMQSIAARLGLKA